MDRNGERVLAIDRQRFKTATVGGDTFVLDEHTGETFRIAGAGPRLWNLLVGGSSISDAAAAVATATGAPYERVSRDAVAFVAALEAAGIVAPTPPDVAASS